jgi:hypothetical protein
VLRVEGPAGWLRSERQYGDFVLRVEFRTLTSDADSGIFVRVAGDREFIRGRPGISYQVQTRDVSKNTTERPRLLGDVYRHQTPAGDTSFDPGLSLRLFKGTGEWHVWEIEARGGTLTVMLDGTMLTRASGIVNPRGSIGIQAETGVLEYRSIAISE